MRDSVRLHRRPAEYDVHVVLDGYSASTHKTPAVKRWLLERPRFDFHFTPAEGKGSWRASLISARTPRQEPTSTLDQRAAV